MSNERGWHQLPQNYKKMLLDTLKVWTAKRFLCPHSSMPQYGALEMS